ncbi:FeoC-like transcriptional regulator [Photobacterium andalusiense]|uniref:FeoC like transcriptional regulator n=1 Tax=Photobacterium andalusiense TaxID=2204296 RepID=A0A1Y6MHG1_9GAMM|nr:FeoC-like transcriptional regulator [Photobacterium andalusiense]SMY35359.1 FeoC like transcriptional regulator [Photobacterium andalusiense]
MVSLITVRNAIRTAKVISLAQLSHTFNSEPQWLLVLLDDLIKRGSIERCEATKNCNQTCHGCQASSQDIIFRWCNERIDITNI